MILEFLQHLQHYLVEIIPALAIGFFLSGLAHEFIPQDWVDRNLGHTGIKAILLATLVGAMLPICCWGALPVAVGFYKKGAKLGPVLSFLIATPATSISALLVTYNILGLKFAIFIFFAVIIMGVVMGIIGNLLKHESKAQEEAEICPDCHVAKATCSHKESIACRIRSVLKYAYIDMPRELGLETMIGVLLAAFVVVSVPIGYIIKHYLSAVGGYAFSLIFGLLMYICSTATVPLADAFIKQGMSVGAAMVLMLVGPISSYGTILVLRKEFGTKILFIYLSLISIMSLLFGYLYSLIA